MKAIKSQNGYTLTELIITVGVIGILAGMAIPAYTDYLKVSKHTTAMQNAEQLAIFLDNYYYENGAYIAGSYVPGGDVVTLPNALGWRPEGDKDNFRYDIEACGGGNINECYTITVTYLLDAGVQESITKLPPP
jgi:type IV pilus assembly protein PilE